MLNPHPSLINFDMKYIDADKIRTEIKRLKAENNCGTDEFIAAKDIAYDKVFDFLENLEEPVTDCHDLTEAAENPYVLNDVSHAAFEYERTRNDLDARSDNEVVRRAFIAGAEWGAEHLAGVRKMISEDLKEAAEKSWVNYEYREDPRGLYSSCYIDAFKAGAEWQKRKQPKVKGYGVMRKMEDPHPDDWYMDERGKEHCWGYKFNEPCPWPAEVYIMEAKEGAER